LLADQGQEVGLKACAIFCGVAQQDFDQAAFARAEMSLNTPTCETVQQRDRLLNQKLFDLFGGHLDAVIRESSFVNRPNDKGPYSILAVNVQR
jgi:hypothetical protein